MLTHSTGVLTMSKMLVRRRLLTLADPAKEVVIELSDVRLEQPGDLVAALLKSVAVAQRKAGLVLVPYHLLGALQQKLGGRLQGVVDALELHVRFELESTALHAEA